MNNFWYTVTAFVGGCALLALGIIVAISVALWFESSRPAPERKPDPTVLEIGE